MALSGTNITGVPGTVISTVCGQPASGTVTNSNDEASPLQAIQNNFATLTAGTCTLAGVITFSSACTFSNQVALQGLTTANDINVTGQLTCEAGSVTLLTGNCYVGTGTTLLTAATLQVGGLTATPIGAAPWGKLLCTAHSTAEFDGAVTFTGAVSCTGTTTIASGGTLALAAGSTFTAATAIQSTTVQVTAALTMTIDASQGNTFYVSPALNTTGAYVLDVINAVDGWHGRVYFAIGGSNVPASVTLELSGNPAAAGFLGSTAALALSKTYRVDMDVVYNGAALSMFYTDVSN